MFKKIKAIINLPDIFQKGKLVASPEAWKRGQIGVGVVAGLLGGIIATSRTFGWDISLTDEQIVDIGSAIVAIVGLFWTPAVTVATTDKLGAKTSD